MAGLSSPAETYHASIRFGFGPKLEEAPPEYPLAWVMTQLRGPDTTLPSSLPSSSQALALLSAYRALPLGNARKTRAAQAIESFFQGEADAYLANLVTTEVPVRERLVMFWANHFAVMASTYPTQLCAGAYVREAIRPYVNGTFSDMFQAVMQHPAMIYSLNDNESVAPGSPKAIAAAKQGNPVTLNENLGREAMELYSVGLAANYTQADVDALAALLAGYKITLTASGGSFFFDTSCVGPAEQVLLGVSYPNTQAGCQAALQALATSPFTYANIAYKLVCHFVSDTPDPSDVQAVYESLVTSGGKLYPAYETLVTLQSAWQPLTKVRTPVDYVVATLRGAGVTAATMPRHANGPLAIMGQPTWAPPFPNGWSCFAADWVAPASMFLRIGYARYMSEQMKYLDAGAIGEAVLGSLMSPGTAAAVSSQPTSQTRLFTLLCSPEFQRR